jgi:hypothetical protein
LSLVICKFSLGWEELLNVYSDQNGKNGNY